MDLNVWTSSVVTSAVSEDSGKWTVTVKRGDGKERALRVNHVVSATGLAETSIGTLKPPYVEGMVSRVMRIEKAMLKSSLCRKSSKEKSYTHSSINGPWIMLERRWSLSVLPRLVRGFDCLRVHSNIRR